MRVLGVDPGGTGALALLTDRGLRLRVEDMPVLRVSRGTGTKAVLDPHMFYDMLSDLAPDIIYMERVQGQRGDGVSAAFNFGKIAGMTEMGCLMTGARFIEVTPPVWKKGMGLVKAAKDDSRALAMKLWPDCASQFGRKEDDGRADASLIAEYGRRQLVSQGVFG